MSNKGLVIVESPTKAKTIGKILGSDYSVVSSMGHLIDLPQKSLGVTIEESFKPQYVVIPGRQKIVSALKKEAKGGRTIYIATDPDREGEAIGWHITSRVLKAKKVVRVIFHEITPAAVQDAFKHPRSFDEHMIEAQAGRRVLDRIVGYFLSPLLWKKITRGLSAGRVQSVALKLIVERDKHIQAFVAQEYWDVTAELEKCEDPQKIPFTAVLTKIHDQKVSIKNEQEASQLVEQLNNKKFIVADVKKREKKRNPDPPFITSTLQQEAFNKLRFNATKTMILAQQLYEGVDIGGEVPVGLITYMRTDSTHIAPEALREVRTYISSKYGKDYLPKTPQVYKVNKLAQEAHEAIRPSVVSYEPESLKEFLTPEQYKIYELIYKRFVASQMMPARFMSTTVSIKADEFLFVASGSTLLFDGFLKISSITDEQEQKKSTIPELKTSEEVRVLKLIPAQHFTKPPARFTDSSLVKALEEQGIGRPSTYAPIIHTLIVRNYVRRIKGYFSPTELGVKVCELLMKYFPRIMDVKFTALMEEKLDEIEEGKLDKIKVLKEFYEPFAKNLDFAQKNIKKEVQTTDEVCEKCGKPMIIKWGRKGKFLSCSAYPACTFSKSITTGVKCPEPGCGGDLIERRSRRGFFYGCSQFPRCRYIAKTLPQDQPQSS